jgi:hypothetical protein
MRQVPFHENPGNACALACYTMAAQYLLPDLNITFEQLGKIANWYKSYVVWGFPVWKWLMDQGLYITDYDVIDYDAWVKDGIAGLKKTPIADEEVNFYIKNTYDLEATRQDIALAFDHPHFRYVMRKPTWKDVLLEFNKPGICDLTLNSNALNKLDGFSGHRVLLIDITEDEAIFHDPSERGGPYRHEQLGFFRKVFESIDGPELTRYSLKP